MRKMNKMIEIAGMTLAIVLALAACSNPAGGGGKDNGGSGGGGTTVIAQGIQVKATPDNGSTFTDSTFTGDFGNCNYSSRTEGGSYYYHVDPITQYAPDSSIKVTNGKLTMTLGVPKAEYLFDMDSEFSGSGITISPSGAKCYAFIGFWTSDGEHDLWCLKDRSALLEVLAYVDRDVNINGTGTDTSDGTTYIYTVNYSLKKGWNYVTYESRDSGGSTVEVKQTSSPTLPTGYNWVIFDRTHG